MQPLPVPVHPPGSARPPVASLRPIGPSRSTPRAPAVDQRTGMDEGSRHLARLLSTYLACLAFAVTFLATNLLGGGLGAALQRGVLAAAVALVVARLLAVAVLDLVFSAMARDRAARQRAEAGE